MFLKKLCIFLAIFYSFSVFAYDIDTKAGKINLVPVQDATASDLFSLPMGKNIKGKFFIFHEKVNGKHVVNGNAEFKNPTNKNMYIVYYIALKDSKNRLICAVSGDLEVGVDNNIHQYASAIMPLPSKLFADITNYEIVLFESFKPIGVNEDKTASM